jgi:membrane-bound lytic murein transglycosylase A
MKRRAAGALVLLAVLLPMLELTAEPSESLGEVRLEPARFESLAGWADDDHGAAFAIFRRSCRSAAERAPPLRPAREAGPELAAVCRAVLALPESPTRAAARGFFKTHFRPHRVLPPAGRGFLTGYFEPEYEGSLAPSATFGTPLLARPDDLVTIAQGDRLPGVEPGLQAARQRDGRFEPYPDRAAIEDGALGERAKAVIYVGDAVDAFVIHVQGSARIRLADGRTVRVAYAGRNGRPYASIGRILVERGHISLAEMSLERLTAWLRAHPEEGRAVMRQNRSYIFFRLADELGPDDGPIGGAGIPLTPGRSLAVDRTIWSYGLPFWIEGELPLPGGGSEPLHRLMIAQDTGSAIVGPARGDFFSGSGAEAGTRAGLLRHPASFAVLLPQARP